MLATALNGVTEEVRLGHAFEAALRADSGMPAEAPASIPHVGGDELPPPLPSQTPERVGAAAGRVAHQAEVNIDRIRQGLSDILVRLDENTRRAIKAAQKGTSSSKPPYSKS